MTQCYLLSVSCRKIVHAAVSSSESQVLTSPWGRMRRINSLIISSFSALCFFALSKETRTGRRETHVGNKHGAPMHPAEDSAGWGTPAVIVSEMREDQKSSHFKVQETARRRGGSRDSGRVFGNGAAELPGLLVCVPHATWHLRLDHSSRAAAAA